MKKVTKIAWSVLFTTFLSAFLFLVNTGPARAPHGGKKFITNRSIASLQEEDFDKQLALYEICYGVKLNTDGCTLERRRVCKAMLVHRLDSTLAEPGTFFRQPLNFDCQDTAFKKKLASLEEAQIPLKPNAEFQAIDRAIEDSIYRETVDTWKDRKARLACSYLVDCKQAMTGHNISLRKVRECMLTKDLAHRKILLDHLGSLVFRVNTKNRSRFLYAEFLDSLKSD